MKVIAVVPCRNEATYIADVVFQLYQIVGLTMVVDDNSTDNSAGKARDAGAYVVKKYGKRGYGATLKVGMNEAIFSGCDIVVTLDGDGQHDPKDIFKVIKPIENGEADIVIGSRFIGNNDLIPRYRKFGIQVITWLYNVFNKQKTSDAQCGYRAYKREVVETLSMKESGMAFSIEMLIKARVLGYRIVEVPVKVLYHRQYSQNSALNPITHGLSVAWATIKWRVMLELIPKLKLWGERK